MAVQVDPIIRPKGLKEATGYSPQRCYELLKAGKFPQPIKLGVGRNGAVGWRLSALNKWLSEREADSSESP